MLNVTLSSPALGGYDAFIISAKVRAPLRSVDRFVGLPIKTYEFIRKHTPNFIVVLCGYTTSQQKNCNSKSSSQYFEKYPLFRQELKDCTPSKYREAVQTDRAI